MVSTVCSPLFLLFRAVCFMLYAKIISIISAVVIEKTWKSLINWTATLSSVIAAECRQQGNHFPHRRRRNPSRIQWLFCLCLCLCLSHSLLYIECAIVNILLFVCWFFSLLFNLNARAWRDLNRIDDSHSPDWKTNDVKTLLFTLFNLYLNLWSVGRLVVVFFHFIRMKPLK